MKKSVVIALTCFLVFLWDLFVMGLVFSGGDLIKTTKSHMKSTCHKLKSHASLEDFDFLTLYPYYIYPHYP